MKNEKLSKEEIIPAEDILTDELAEGVSGGAFGICLKGCKSGDAPVKDSTEDPDERP